MQSQPMNQCTGIYLGKVIQHLSHGQLKVYVHGVYPVEWEQNPDLLPVCMQMTPQFAGSNNGNGVFSYPNIGSTVICVFANGDQNFPITLGSLLGGPNSFGQYELIKQPTEPISDRHLITSGKSHIELFESGKISAVVVDPIRTDAEVKHSDIPNAEISTDAVSKRPICEPVDAKEISSVNCQFVMDNYADHGEISASTHWFNPLNKLSTTFLSSEQITITDTLNGTDEYNSYYSIDNAGNINTKQISSIQQTSSYNVTDIPKKATEQTVIPLTSDTTINEYSYIGGQCGRDITSSLIDNYAYAYVSQEKNVISAHNIKNTADSAIFQTIDGNFAMTGNVNRKITEQYTNNTTGDSKTFDAKQKLTNTIEATSDSQIIFQTLSSNNSTKIDAKEGINPHTNNHDAQGLININSNSGIYTYSQWKDDDKLNETHIVQENIAKYDISVNPQVYSDQFIRRTYNKDDIDKIDIQCQSLMSPSDAKFDIKIENNQTGMYCKILMDADGNMTIDASTELTLKAPKINILATAQLSANAPNINVEATTELNEKSKTVNVEATEKLDIKGASGDCKIANVSLLDHVHNVGSSSTQSAAASN